MRAIRPLILTSLVFLFMAEGQRAYFASMFGLAADALFPEVRAGPALLALLPLALIAIPLLPLARWLDRRAAVAVAAVAVALFRLPMTHPALEARLVGGALVLAGGFAFLVWAVGYLDRRAVAAGAVLGLVVDQLLRLAGTSYDLSLRPSWFPVQAVLSLALVWVAFAWSRAPGAGLDPERAAGRGEGLERRAGGLRLRGGIALGALLFADLHVLGLGAAVARLTGTPYDLTALALLAAGAAAVGIASAARRPTGDRAVTMALTAVLAIGLAASLTAGGFVGVAAVAAGHLAALLLVTRALEPASGRRGGGAAVAGLAVLIAATGTYSLTFYHAFALPLLAGAAPWVFGAVALLVAGAFILMPRPSAVDSPAGAAAAAGLATTILAAGALLRVAATEPWSGRPDSAPSPVQAEELRVITWNLHYGFSGDWRFDPERVASALAPEAPDVVALQEVPAGLPTAYGMDVALWLGARLGMRSHFAPTVNGLLGDAFLERVPGASVDADPLPAGGGDPKQHLRLVVPVSGGALTLHALHLAVSEEARPAQVAAVLDRVPPGPAVVMGDLNDGPGGDVASALRDAGFRDVFEDAGSPGPTWPAAAPTVRIDWIWIRGLRARSASTLTDLPSDHRAVAATLELPPERPR